MKTITYTQITSHAHKYFIHLEFLKIKIKIKMIQQRFPLDQSIWIISHRSDDKYS